nr:hypothetical protein [Tanacetum cinerariifolium]
MENPWSSYQGRRQAMTDADYQELKFCSQRSEDVRSYPIPANNDIMLDRLKFISKEEIHQAYGKSILDSLITDDIQNSKAYKLFIGISTALIPPTLGRGKGAQETKAVVILKKANATSKKKGPKKKVLIRDESDSSQKLKLKGIELLSDAIQLEVDIQKEIKASTRKSRFKDQSGGSSSTDDEKFLIDDKEENPKEIRWVSTDDDDETKDDKEEDDKSIDIEKTDVEDQVNEVAEINIAKEVEKENVEKVKEQKADDELKVDEEQQGDDQARDEQVGVVILFLPTLIFCLVILLMHL